MRLRVRPLPLLFVALLAFAAGCGGGHDVTEKQLADMRAEIAKLRASNAALSERVDTLEIGRGTFAKDAPAADAPRPPDRDRPDLDVVRLAPGEGEGDADPEAPRPMIRAVGEGGSVQQPAKKDKTAGARSAPKKGVVAATPKKADVPKP
jgi:hypothetical protein